MPPAKYTVVNGFIILLYCNNLNHVEKHAKIQSISTV
jgi:hypothetical protein